MLEKSVHTERHGYRAEGDERIRTAVPAPSTDSAYDRLAWFIDCEKSGTDHHWQYDPRADIERLLLAFRYLHDSTLLVQGGCDTAHLDLGLDAATNALRRESAC